MVDEGKGYSADVSIKEQQQQQQVDTEEEGTEDGNSP